MQIAEKRKKRERAHLLSIMATASRGKSDDIKMLLKEWND